MSELHKSLGPVTGAAMMLNVVLGTGLLILPGLAAAQSGAASLWTWIAASVASVPLLMVFALLAGRFPGAGGIAHIAGSAFGRTALVITSFVFLGAVVLGLPAIALTGGYYLEAVSGIPAAFCALAILLAATSANLLAPQIASRVGATASGLVLVFILGVIGVSVAALSIGGLEDAQLMQAIDPDVLSVSAALAPFMAVFFAFTGWEVAISTTEEFRNPRRDVPLAIAMSFIMAIVLYFACAVVVLLAGQDAFNAAPFVYILQPVFGQTSAAFLSAGAVLLITANLFAAIWGVSRLIFSLARQEVFPVLLARTTGGTPRHAVAFLGAILLLVVLADATGLLGVEAMLSSAGQNFLILYGVSAAALFKTAESGAGRALAVLSLTTIATLFYASNTPPLYPLALAALGTAVAWLPVGQSAANADHLEKLD